MDPPDAGRQAKCPVGLSTPIQAMKKHDNFVQLVQKNGVLSQNIEKALCRSLFDGRQIFLETVGKLLRSYVGVMSSGFGL
jgi:hypothetical protein